ncbi:type IV pilus modification PilV family protein [Acidithiobacillus ferriphilus]|uniref:type IV pilus modification PilV family protein n=1 Tax=Acidithiobacillus ferriphilus TaxID=1689834 RepID=UPI001C069D8D|nr:prepilin-type N-terminal cleavage/methylation domain-containing protein [Acidithiobacillus ferriphilus]MBU2829865.1 type II secretion system protein [Acidithiobacillus ferriphilus]
MSRVALRGKEHGVTLIELVIGMALMGFLAALIIPVVWYGRFGANPVPTAQATAIAQSTLEQGMVANYKSPFGNGCKGKPSPTPANSYGFSITTNCTENKLKLRTKNKQQWIPKKDAEYLTVQVRGPSGADITLGAWRTKYCFGSSCP